MRRSTPAVTINNVHLFALINAAPGLLAWPLALVRVLAVGLVFALPLRLALAWVRGDLVARRELCEMLLAVALALALAQLVALVWPQPRPAALHLGQQYLAHAQGSGLPSLHVTMFWSLGLAALVTRRFGLWALPLLSLGLAVGWSRVYLGAHMPYDVLAAAPVALAGAMLARLLRPELAPFVVRWLYLYDRLERQFQAWRTGRPGRPGA